MVWVVPENSMAMVISGCYVLYSVICVTEMQVEEWTELCKSLHLAHLLKFCPEESFRRELGVGVL